MAQTVSKNPIIKKIVDLEAKDEILELFTSHNLPLTEEEYLEGLVYVLKSERYKDRAMEQLKQVGESTKINYVERIAANHRVAYFILLEALNQKNSKVVSKIIRNQAFPHEFLEKIAEKGDCQMLEALLDNQIKLIAFPEIMDILEKNPEANNFIKGKIQEIREFYLENQKVEVIPAEIVIDDIKEIAKKSEKTSTKSESEETEEDENDEKGEEDDDILNIEKKALNVLQEINNMNISDRIKLAITGTRTHRMILIKDSNKMVSLAVIESPKLTIDEVLLVCRNKSIAGDIIAKVSRNRDWIKNYAVVLELIQNPKTPIKDALSFINRLHIQDLKLIGKDKNVNPVVRQVAFNLYAQKNTSKR